jgi:YD repeat-containing protein
VSLVLHDEQGTTLVPQNPIVPVSISQMASRGISLPEGLTVASTVASADPPVVIGNQAVWAGSSTDTDLMVEPVPLGIEISWQLRSQSSPESNSLTFRLTRGESLQMSARSQGSVEVIRAGIPVILISPADARQSNGKPLTASYSLSGDVLTTSVDLQGNVDFPVLVDPKIVVAHYGEEGKGWQGRENRGSWHAAENCSCIGFGPFRGTGEGLWRTVPPPFENSFGQWFLNPDGGSEVKITRVDVSGLTNTRSANWLEAGIYEQPGNKINENGHGIYSYNGYAGPSGVTPLFFNGENGGSNEGKTVAFCAVGAGGNDGGSQPLCNENEGGEGFALGMYKESAGGTSEGTVGIETAQVRFIQSSHPSVKLEQVSTGWFNSIREGSVAVSGEDHGTGVAELAVDAVPGTQSEIEGSASATPEPWGSHRVPGTNPYTTDCPNAFCLESVTNVPFTLSGLGTGIWDVAGWARNPVGYEHEESHVALIDDTPPELPTPSWAGDTFDDAAHELSFTAQDGNAGAPQSGVDRVWLEVDGRVLYNNTTSCPAPEHKVPTGACYGLSGNYTLQAEELAAGEHTITLHAKDWTGNESEKRVQITTVHPTGQMQQVGPGTLNLQSGDYQLSASDASFSAGGGADLTVSRTYDSQSAISGPLGPGWTLSTPDTSAAGQWQSLERLSNGNIEASTTSGRKVLFTAKEGRFSAPSGYQTYTLTETGSSPAVYQIADAGGDYTEFEVPPRASLFVPTRVAQASVVGGLNGVTYVLQEGRASEIVGPEPAGVSCKERPLETKGCRVLALHYGAKTTASGEGASEWGEYSGRLASISFTAWDPAKGGMSQVTVAQYAYDAQGRLRTEWDPRISPALKTTYGYDGEGHLTALAPPGYQPYLFHYGTVAGQVGDAWLLSVTRPGTETEAGDGKAPKDTGLPKLSSATPVVGATLQVKKTGKWGDAPLAFAYQWEDCNRSGVECSAIFGATNGSYTPQRADVGHTLLAQVSAQNAAGAQTAATAATGVVPAGESTNNPVPTPPAPGTSAVTTIEYHVSVFGAGAPYSMGSKEVAAWAQGDAPSGATAILPPDQPAGWPTGSYQRATLYYFDSFERRVNVASPGGAVSTTLYDNHDNVDWTLTAGNRQRALEAGGGSGAAAEKLATENNYSSDGTELERSLGPQHEVKLASGQLVTARAFTRYYYDEGAPSTGGPYRLVTKSLEGAQVESGTESGKEADVRTIRDSYTGQQNLGWALHKATAVTTEVAPGKTSSRTSVYDPATGDVTETSSPAGSGGENQLPVFSSKFGSQGSGGGQLAAPKQLATDGKGNIWVTDAHNNRLEVFSEKGEYLKAVGSPGSGNGQFKEPSGIAADAKGNVWVADTANNRLEEFTESGGFEKAIGSAGSGNGQFNEPTGTTIDAHSNIWIADTKNNRVEEFSEKGAYVTSVGKVGTGDGQLNEPKAVAIDAHGNLLIADSANDRIEEFNEKGEYVKTLGSLGSENGQLKSPTAVTVDSHGGLWVADGENNRIEEFNERGEYVAALGGAGTGSGQFANPEGLAMDASGALIVSDEGNNRVERFRNGNPAAHTSQTIYYTNAADATYPACGGHPEWANLPCEARAAAQPGTAGLPEVPTSSTTYNVWDEVAGVTRTSGSSTRTSTTTYDPAGRTEATAVNSSTGKRVPTVTLKYDEKTGALATQSTTSEGATQTTTSKQDSLGELTSYTDATGVISTYAYDIDGRLSEAFDGKGTRTYAYDATTGQLRTLKDSAVGTFTATYDPEGRVHSQAYPNGMSASYAYNSTGQAMSVAYTKGSSRWYEDTVVPSIHGQWLSQQSTLASDVYTYDNVGRLTEASETPQGRGCATLLYRYDEDSNRTSETARQSSSPTCATSGGTSLSHSYDSADRLADSGAQYEVFGADTSLPAADAGGQPLETNYYADGAIYSQTQNEQSNSYVLDPAGRVRETTTVAKLSSKSTISHYSGSSATAAWTEEKGGASSSRAIAGINGSLCATQTNSETPLIQITNLHGDVVGTVPDSTEAKVATLSSEPTAFGVPTSATSSRYGWLGAGGVQTEFESGISASSAGSYVPQLGIHLRPEALSGSALQDPTDEYLANRQYAQPGIGFNGESPTGINPLPVNGQVEEEFWAHPPWDVGPVNGGEETFGDPVHCYVSGRTVVGGNDFGVFGDGGCSEGLPQGTWIYVCVGAVNAFGKTGGCKNHVTVEHHRSRSWALGVSGALQCEPGETLRALVEFYVPGGKVLYAGTENGGECGGGNDGVSEAALTLFASPDTSGALELLLSFFRE